VTERLAAGVRLGLAPIQMLGGKTRVHGGRGKEKSGERLAGKGS